PSLRRLRKLACAGIHAFLSSKDVDGRDKPGHDNEENTAMDAWYPQLVALLQIVIIDVVLAGDNAVVVGMAAARLPLEQRKRVIGLSLSVLLMGVVANWIARLLDRHGWIAWLGLLVILQVALDMIWSGSHEVACAFVPKAICDNGFIATVMSLVGLR